MLSYNLKINYGNLRIPIEADYMNMLDTLSRCVVFDVSHMWLTQHITFRHLQFESRYLQDIFQKAMGATSVPELVQTVGLQDTVPIATDMLGYVEDFLGMYYHQKRLNYLMVTIDPTYNLHVGLKQI